MSQPTPAPLSWAPTFVDDSPFVTCRDALRNMPYKNWGYIVLICVVGGACAPSPDTVGAREIVYDAANFGHPDSVLFWNPDQQLAGFRNYDRLFPTRTIAASDSVLPLAVQLRDVSQLRYQVEGDTFDIQGFREHNRIAGLLAIKDRTIVLEEYDRGNTPGTKWVSYSVTKSVVSMLVGAAIQDGYISEVEDAVTDYVPLLRGTSYEGVMIRDLLQMSSGVAWNEDYTDPLSDLSKEIGLPSLDRLEAMGSHPRVAEPGRLFNYSTGEAHLVGGVLRSAIGNNLATYLTNKIWQPFGMESDAYWRLVEPGGAEHGGCCISATLRDYGRIGLFALGNGVLPDGREILPRDWIGHSTNPSPTNDGFGYLWWLGPNDTYSALGIFGQAISINPAENLIIVTHGVWPRATGTEFSDHRVAFFSALTHALRK